MSRRALLRGAGGVAIALPWLEVMGAERTAHAKSPPAKHLVNVFTPGGTLLKTWAPAERLAEDNFKLGPLLAPLAPHQNRLIGFTGVDLAAAKILGGEQDQSGLVGWLTGIAQPGAGKYSTGPSIDQVLAPRLSKGSARDSLYLAVRWGTGKCHGLPHPANIACYADDGAATPVLPQLDPQVVWQALFGTRQPSPNDWDRSMLDAVAERYSRLLQRVGKADRERLEAHLSKIRELEQQLAAIPSCSAPPLVDTSDYDPLSGLNSADDGSTVDAATDAAIPRVGRFMMDMLVMALACRITSVATLQWCDTEAKHTYPWLGLPHHLRYYMNDGGHQPVECAKIFTWYAEQHAYLIEQLSLAQTATGSLLDETIVFIGSNLQNPADHVKTDMPYLLAGGGGGLRTGRWLERDREPHNNLLVALLNLFGDERQTFGTPEACTGPMQGLT